MKIAIVHDWFHSRAGGAEQVVKELAELYPDAPIYTLLYNKQRFGNIIDPDRIHTSLLQKVPQVLKTPPKYLLPLIPASVKSLRLNQYDVVVSSSSAFVKNINIKPGTLHICYCHTPMRFAWDYQQQYLAEQQLDPLRQAAAIRFIKWIRRWDLNKSKAINYWIANSKTTEARIKKYYQKDSTIIYPPVHIERLKPNRHKQNYYITLSGLTPYKKLDLAIEACNLSGRELYVVGDGNDRKRLERLAGSNIHFTGFIDEAKKVNLLAAAKGLIYPNVEDFGIAPVEAMAAGTPVIAFGKGGVTESVKEPATGLFFDKQTPEALNRTLDKFENMKFSTAALTSQADQFNASRFRAKITQYINKSYTEYAKSQQ